MEQKTSRILRPKAKNPQKITKDSNPFKHIYRHICNLFKKILSKYRFRNVPKINRILYLQASRTKQLNDRNEEIPLLKTISSEFVVQQRIVMQTLFILKQIPFEKRRILQYLIRKGLDDKIKRRQKKNAKNAKRMRQKVNQSQETLRKIIEFKQIFFKHLNRSNSTLMQNEELQYICKSMCQDLIPEPKCKEITFIQTKKREKWKEVFTCFQKLMDDQSKLFNILIIPSEKIENDENQNESEQNENESDQNKDESHQSQAGRYQMNEMVGKSPNFFPLQHQNQEMSNKQPLEPQQHLIPWKYHSQNDINNYIKSLLNLQRFDDAISQQERKASHVCQTAEKLSFSQFQDRPQSDQ